MITLRDATFPQDLERIGRIDTSFTTDTIYTAYRDGDQLGLRLKTLPTPIVKRFPLVDLEKRSRRGEFAAVAADGDHICAFIAAAYDAWNRRVTILHLYVDGPDRRRGIARLLVDRARTFAIGNGALNLWLETSNLNVPGIRAYRRLGFELCGLDTTLYHGTPAADETALFFARPVADDAL